MVIIIVNLNLENLNNNNKEIYFNSNDNVQIV